VQVAPYRAGAERKRTGFGESNVLPALVLGSGITALGVIRSLGRGDIPRLSVCPDRDVLLKSRWYRPAPRLHGRVPEPADLAAYLANLTIPAAVLIPCSDEWALAVAELPAELKERFPASVPSASVLRTMTDKWRFAEVTTRLGIPRPATVLLESRDQMEMLGEDAYQNRFLKPIESQKFSERNKVKAYRVRDKHHAIQIMEGQTFPILLQEYIPGPANSYYLVDGFVDRHGRTKALIARRRKRMYPTDFGNSTLSETIPLRDVQGAVRSLERLWSEVEFRGIFDAEFKYDDRDGQFKIIEVNARPWWHVGFVDRCGVDLCGMAYRDAAGFEIEQSRSYPVGKRVAYLVSDLRAYCSADPGLLGLLRWRRSWRGAYDAVFCWQDPGPGIAQTLGLFKHFGQLVATVRGRL
jgi:D-aspartate ligase